MFKMGRLLRGELNKILMRPILYVITGIIVIALFFSATLISMQNRESFEYKIDTTSNTKTMESFSSNTNMNKAKADKNVEDAFSKLSFYSTLNATQNSTITAQLKNLLGESDDPIGGKTAFNAYQHNIQFLQSEGKTEASTTLLQDRLDMLNSLTKAKEMLINAATKDTPTVIMKQSQYDIFIDIITDAITYLTAKGADLNVLETHITIKEKILNPVGYSHIVGLDYFDKLYHIASNEVTNIVLPKTLVENLTEKHNIVLKYLDKTYKKINELYGDEKTETVQLKNQILNYYYMADQYKSLVDQTIYLEPVKTFNDSKAHSFINYTDVHLYQIQENISKNNALIANELTTNQFSSVFTPTISSGDKISAYDLVFFGLEICTFVILIFCVILAAGMIAGEQSAGTLKVLAIRPFKRGKILTAKILATLIFGVIFMIFSTLVLFLIGFTMYGLDNTPILGIFNATTVFTLHPAIMLLIYLGLAMVKILFYVLLATAISTIFRSNVGAVAVSIFIYFLTALFAVLFTSSSWYAFMPFAAIDLFKYFGGAFATNINNPLGIAFSSPMFYNSNLVISCIIITVTMLLLTFISYYVFKKREIK